MDGSGMFMKVDHAVLTFYQRSNLGDPSFVKGLDAYQQEMLNETTTANIRNQISSIRTLNVSEYNPTGLEGVLEA